MKQQFLTVLLIILLMLFAQGSRFLVETPVYGVSAMHSLLIFAAAIAAWFSISLGGVRKSYPLYASGLGLTFLGLAAALFPDLWLRWPEATLAGLAISQLGALVLPRPVIYSGRLLLIMAILIGLVSLLPLAATVYLPWDSNFRPIIAGTSVALLVAAAVIAWVRRQRNFNLAAVAALAFWTVIAAGLAAVAFQPGLGAGGGRRIAAEEWMFVGLLIIGACHIIDQVQVERQLRSGRHMDLEASMKDELTGVANRRALDVFGPNLIAQSRDAGRAISVLMADIDHFKQINDTRGHQAGDSVLQQTAQKFVSQVRKSDLVARYGGEEFVILLPGSPLAPALRLAERIRSVIEAECAVHEGQEFSRTISIGVATAFPEEPTSLADLIKRADANLYRAKHEGRNRVCADALPSDDF